jgi:hypothetical protein
MMDGTYTPKEEEQIMINTAQKNPGLAMGTSKTRRRP